MPRLPPNKSQGAGKLRIWTIGHSNHPFEHFANLLRKYEIEVVVDVRSVPYSRFSPQFRKESLVAALKAANIQYLFLGAELGGRPQDMSFYDSDGRVLYGRLAESPPFQSGIERLQTGAGEYRCAIMCSEEDPAGCHRHLLVGRVLTRIDMKVSHLRGDERIQSFDEIELQILQSNQHSEGLFEVASQSDWKSPSPIRRRSST